MLGNRTASLAPFPRDLILRYWGYPDVHTRQKWAIVWDSLKNVPECNVSLLDAGCGTGRWSTELALLRQGWRITGIDRNADSIRRAEWGRQKLGVQNLRFNCVDFLGFDPPSPFDVVICVASAHYLAEDGRGDAFFARVHSWLSPGGMLLLLGPRVWNEVPRCRSLPDLPRRQVFSGDELRTLSEGAGFVIRSLSPQVGACGTMAKQLAVLQARRSYFAPFLYPSQLLLDYADRLSKAKGSNLSYFWLLDCRKPT
jgi:SAM-dependent methyltransferase